MADERLTRRECLARGAGAVLAAGAAAAGGYLLYDPIGDASLPDALGAAPRLKDYFSAIDFAAANPRLSIATSAAVAPSSLVRESPLAPSPAIEKLVRAAVTGLDPSLGMKRFITAGDVVLIKPNAGFDRPPHLGATTNPEVLRGVIRLCREAGARRILIADNPIESPDACFAKSGIRQVADAEGAEIILPAEARFQNVMICESEPHRRRRRGDRQPAAGAPGSDVGLPARWPILYDPLAQATKLIGVAPVKDHNLASASITLKNWYGLLGGRRNRFHQAIHEVISDLALLVSPTLVIADATRVMMCNGPTGGRITDVQPGGALGRPAVIAAVDHVACDAWCYQNLLGRDPQQLPYLAQAANKIKRGTTATSRRMGESDWHVYERQGKIATASV